MATVDSKTSAKIDDLVDDTVVSGHVTDGVLHLVTKSGNEIFAGQVSTTVAVNVKEHGAVANGTVDDTTAIHEARDVAGVGGVVYFPKGTYNSSGLIANVAGQQWILAPGSVLVQTTKTNHVLQVSASNVSIVGPGKLDAGSGSNYSGVMVNAAANDVSLIGLEVTNGLYAVRCKGVSGPVTYRLRVANCYIHDTPNAIFFNAETTDALVESNYINAVGMGIKILGHTTGATTSDRAVVVKNHITGVTGSEGIHLRDAPYSVVQGNNIDFATNTTGIGISLDGASNYCMITGNIVRNPILYGLEAAGNTNCTYANNLIYGCGDSGIGLNKPGSQSPDDITVMGNVIVNSAGSGISFGFGKRVRIIGNDIYDPGVGTANKIAITGSYNSGASHAVIANNTIKYMTATANAINPDNPNAVVANNTIIYDSGLAAAGATAIWLGDTADDCLVIGNNIQGNSKLNNGINISNGVTGANILGNRITGTVQYLIRDNSPGSKTNVISNNLGTSAAGSGFSFASAGAIGSNNVDTTTQTYGVYQGGMMFGWNSTDTVGFYGKTPVARGAALTAQTAAAPAGGTGTAAGGYDTAGNRDTMIALVNNLRTRVGELESRLSAYGLLP